MSHRTGILAYGSLIDDPGDELAPLIIERLPQITPFKVEYARISSSRDNAPTLIPVQEGGCAVPATILVLRDDVSLAFAKDMLWRRETRQPDRKRKYPAATGVNAVQIVTVPRLAGVENVLYTVIGSNMGRVVPQALAKYAINSILGTAGQRKMDGIRYLLNNKNNGIITPLTQDYEIEILRLTQTDSLDAAIELLDAERATELQDDQEEWGAFEVEVREIGDLINQYGLDATLEECPWTTGNFQAYIQANELAFVSNCHTGWKMAQKKIVTKMLLLESQMEQADTGIKSLKDKQGPELRKLKKVLLDNEHKSVILRHMVDTIAWQMIKGELYVARRLYQKVSGHKRLSKTNIESVIEAAEKLNEKRENFALITDLSAYIQSGDILWKQHAERSLGIVEVKTGSKNREIMDVIHDIADPSIPIEDVLPNIKGDKKTLEQFQRSLDQFKKGLSVASILTNDGGTDFEGKKVTIITPEEPTPRFDDQLRELGRKLQGEQQWAYTAIESCLHVGLYKGMHKILGPMILKGLAAEHGHQGILVDHATVLNSLHRPVFTLPFSKELIYDLVFGRAKLYFLLELEPFLAFFEEFGMKAQWLSKSETAKITDQHKGSELFKYEHRALKVTHPDSKHPLYVNVGLFGKIFFEHINPRYVAYSQSYFFGAHFEIEDEENEDI